ncbi:MAG: hypothetical protein ACTSXS_06420 [Candidatus Thorarchaeota archaeon]
MELLIYDYKHSHGEQLATTKCQPATERGPHPVHLYGTLGRGTDGLDTRKIWKPPPRRGHGVPLATGTNTLSQVGHGADTRLLADQKCRTEPATPLSQDGLE